MEGTYTCGTGQGPWVNHVARATQDRVVLMQKNASSYGSLSRDKSQNSLDSQVWCAKLYTDSIADAPDGKTNYRFVKQSDIDTGPYNANNCEYIFGPG